MRDGRVFDLYFKIKLQEEEKFSFEVTPKSKQTTTHIKSIIHYISLNTHLKFIF